MRAVELCCFETKLPNLMMKTWLKQFLASLILDITLQLSILQKTKTNVIIIKLILAFRTKLFEQKFKNLSQLLQDFVPALHT